MLIRYLVELREPINIEDHWPIPIMGGEFRAVSQDGVVIAFEISFSGQSVDMAPILERHEEGNVAFTMNGRDKLLPFVKNATGRDAGLFPVLFRCGNSC